MFLSDSSSCKYLFQKSQKFQQLEIVTAIFSASAASGKMKF